VTSSKKAFDDVDTDKDGVIDRGEYKRAHVQGPRKPPIGSVEAKTASRKALRKQRKASRGHNATRNAATPHAASPHAAVSRQGVVYRERRTKVVIRRHQRSRRPNGLHNQWTAVGGQQAVSVMEVKAPKEDAMLESRANNARAKAKTLKEKSDRLRAQLQKVLAERKAELSDATRMSTLAREIRVKRTKKKLKAQLQAERRDRRMIEATRAKLSSQSSVLARRPTSPKTKVKSSPSVPKLGRSFAASFAANFKAAMAEELEEEADAP